MDPHPHPLDPRLRQGGYASVSALQMEGSAFDSAAAAAGAGAATEDAAAQGGKSILPLLRGEQQHRAQADSYPRSSAGSSLSLMSEAEFEAFSEWPSRPVTDAATAEEERARTKLGPRRPAAHQFTFPARGGGAASAPTSRASSLSSGPSTSASAAAGLTPQRSAPGSRASTVSNTPEGSPKRRAESVEEEAGLEPPQMFVLDAVQLKDDVSGAVLTVPELDASVVPPPENASVWPSVVLSVFGGSVYGYNTAIIAGLSGPLVESTFFSGAATQFQASMTGVLTACILVGAFVGTMVSMPLANRFGRSAAFVVSGAVCVAACVGMALVEDFVGLVLLRTALGLSVGATTTVCPLYNAECTPLKRRGMVGTVFQISIVASILVAEVVNYLFNPSNVRELAPWVWHTQFLLGGVWGAGLIAAGVIAPESRVWRARQAKRERKEKQQLEQRRASWAQQRMEEDSQAHGANREREAEQQHLAPRPPTATPTQLQQPQPLAPVALHPEPAAAALPKGWKGLFHRSNLRWLAFALLLPASNQLTGINAIIYYAPEIFTRAGYERLALLLTLSVVGSFNLFAVLLSLPLIRVLSRRKMMLAAHGVMALGLALITLAFFALPQASAAPAAIAAILLFILGFEIGPGPLFFILASEAFPNEILHAGLSLANQAAWLCNILITFLFPLMNAAIGAAATFAIFLAVCLACIVAYVFLLPRHPEAHVITADESPEGGAYAATADDENQIEMMKSPPAAGATSSAAAATDQLQLHRKQVSASPPYQLKDQQHAQQLSEVEFDKHPLQSPLARATRTEA